MPKKKMLMFISSLELTEVSVIIPTIAWIAEKKGLIYEAYLESERDGTLFAKTGSTVIGGNHFQQFNYLNAYYDISYVIYGKVGLYQSSIKSFAADIIIETDDIDELYEALKNKYQVSEEHTVLFDAAYGKEGTSSHEFIPYFYPEILFREAWGYIGERGNYEDRTDLTYIEAVADDARVEDISSKVANHFADDTKGVAFGDPDIILSVMATLCRDKYVSLYGPVVKKDNKDIVVSAYTEEATNVMDVIEKLTEKSGNKVIVGRQTGDGDIFELGKRGICIKIMDPNRPAFPSVTTIPYQWNNKTRGWDEEEPDDEELIKYAKQGKILTSLIWHSGEIAHNEAMVNLMDLGSFTGIKMGFGVHAARYQTSLQLWELLSIDRSQGGVRGLIEPILHSGGMGIMTEFNCPPEYLKMHCEQANKEISAIAGKAGMPKGYMSFLDTDLKTLTDINEDIFKAVEDVGFDYFISSALPGRNRIVYNGKQMIAFNQTPRNVCAGSPYVRMSVVEDLYESERMSPGWVIGTLDSPVVAFSPYIWNKGNRFMEIVNWMVHGDVINVLPHTISRYARILRELGYIE
jgi:hypothetical protein